MQLNIHFRRFFFLQFTTNLNYEELHIEVRHGLNQIRLIGSSTLFEVSMKCFPIISCLKCTVNSYFHLFRRKPLLTNDFKLTVLDLYSVICVKFRYFKSFIKESLLFYIS